MRKIKSAYGLCLIAAICLIMAVLSACGGDTASQDTTSESGSPSEAAETVAPDEAAEPANTVSVVFDEFYYLDGNDYIDSSFIFYTDGKGELEIPGEVTECDYTVENGKVLMYVNGTGAEPIILTVIDEFTITDGDGYEYIRIIEDNALNTGGSEAAGQSDDMPIDKERAESLVMDATKDNAQSITGSGGKPVYIFNGEGIMNDGTAWFFLLADEARGESSEPESYAVDDMGAVWGLDIFGKWINISNAFNAQP